MDEKIKRSQPGANTLSNTITQDQILPSAVKPRHLVVSPQINGQLYYGDGTNFVGILPGDVGQVLTIAGSIPTWSYLLQTGIAASRPVSGAFVGAQYFSTDTFTLSIWDGSAYESVTLS